MQENRQYWDDVEILFATAIELDGDTRRTFLDKRCHGQPTLRRDVESLLAADERAGQTMELSASFSSGEVPKPALTVGDCLGAFRLGGEIGLGGMGSVFHARRADGSFDQDVAIKIIATPLVDRTASRRFQAERQILASLQHPNVVTLLDGGITRDGRGYLVMEYVEGVPITDYCRRHALSLEALLEIFSQVLGAAHYAHRHGIVHRDLKPANVLVTEEGVPKVLDFGIAKILDSPVADEKTVTGFGFAPLTPDYASPEQLRGLAVTTSSDTYSLGVLLFELITGQRPYDTAGKTLDEILDLVVEREPPRPSSVAAGSSVPYDSSRKLHGDLDAIVGQAIAKQPEERYGSASELAADLKRYVQGEPVAAHPPTLAYLARRLARKHRLAFIVAVSSFLLIVAATSLALWQARIASVERDRADRRFREVRALANTLIFDIHDAVEPLAGSTPVRKKIVAEALEYLEALALDADGDAGLAEELGRAYTRVGSIQGLPSVPNLGDRQGALDSLEKSRAILEPLAADGNARVETVDHYVEAVVSLSGTLISLERGAEARAVMLEALRTADFLRARHPGNEETLRIAARANFATALAHGYPDSLPYWKASEAMYESLLANDPDHPARQRNAALVRKYLGSYYYSANEHDKAAVYHESALSLDEKRLSRDPNDRQAQFDVAIDLSNIGSIRMEGGKLGEAVSLFERSLVYRRKLAETDPENELAQGRLAYMHGRLGQAYEQLGDLSRAILHAHEAIDTLDALPSLWSALEIDQAKSLWLLARLQRTRDESSESCASLGRAVTMMQSLDGSQRKGFAGQEDPLPAMLRQWAECDVRSEGPGP